MGAILQGKLWLLGALTVAIGGAVVAVVHALLDSPEAPPPAAGPATLQAPAASPATAPAAAPPAAAEAAPRAVLAPPAFDVVRVAEDGGALVAGSAPAGAAVVLRVDEAEVAQTAADPAGQFVALFTLAPSEAPQVLTAEAVLADGRVLRSGDRVVLTPRLPPAAPVAEPAEVAPPAPAIAAAAPEPAPPAAQERIALAEPAAEAIALPEAPFAATVAEPAAIPQTPVGETIAETAVTPEATLAGAESGSGSEAPAPAAPTVAEVPSQPPAPVVAEVAPEPVPAPGPVAPPAASEPAPEIPALAAAAIEETPMPRAFVVRESGAVQVLDRAPRVMDNVVVDVISYSDTGEVQISGRAAQGGAGVRVQIYLDNRPVALALAENGDWSSDLPDVDPGIYTLRVDQIGPEGRVVSRFETPFQREDPVLVAAARARMAPAQGAAAGGSIRLDPPAAEAPPAATATDDPVAAPAAAAAESPAEPPVSLITVQPGHSLWRISAEHYGEGARYVVIYRANRAQIRNPDLIYPGQVFVLPD